MRTPPTSPPAAPPAGADGRPGGYGPRPRRSGGDGRGQDGEGRGGQYGGAETLHTTGGEQLPALLRETAGEGRGGEDTEPGEEHPLAPEDVGGPAAQEHETGEGDRVGVEDPLETDGAQAQVGAHRRQCDVDDRDVEYDEELPGARGEDDGPRTGRPRAAAGLARVIGICVCIGDCRDLGHGGNGPSPTPAPYIGISAYRTPDRMA